VKRLLLVLVVAGATIAVITQVSFGATTDNVSAKEFSFTLSKRSVRHGTVTFRLTNRGRTGHDFKIAGRKTPIIRPGRSATLRVTLRRGTYRYICTVPGHASAGMKGTLRVR
jgi:plastocyanin